MLVATEKEDLNRASRAESRTCAQIARAWESCCISEAITTGSVRREEF